jgi:hypothetical protein
MRPYGEIKRVIRNAGCWIPRMKVWKRLHRLDKAEWAPTPRRLGRVRARQSALLYIRKWFYSE